MGKLISVGLDVGTTSTQMILSELSVENKGGAFSVPDMVIENRKILYQSPVVFTPFLSKELVNGAAIAGWVLDQYAAAGISKSQVDTGAVIITGETSRKENARQVLSSLAGFAGDFVVATAGPDLESVLAAKGAGATDYSQRTGKTVLHMDIGGGTSNLAYVKDGNILRTGCLNVGGRLMKFDNTGALTYLSPALTGLCDLHIGDRPDAQQLWQVTALLTQALEMAAGLRPKTEIFYALVTKEAVSLWDCEKADVISFSGGVADCIFRELPDFAFGDLGVLLGRAIRRSALCRQEYRLGEQTIRATVIGAGCHSTQLSGSTVFVSGISLPRQNLPVVSLPTPPTPEQVQQAYGGQDGDAVVLALAGFSAPSYGQIRELAASLAEGSRGRELLVCLQSDMAKALGHAIKLLDADKHCLCIDRVHLQKESYLDIGAPVGPALPVVIKTLILSQKNEVFQ